MNNHCNVDNFNCAINFVHNNKNLQYANINYNLINDRYTQSKDEQMCFSTVPCKKMFHKDKYLKSKPIKEFPSHDLESLYNYDHTNFQRGTIFEPFAKRLPVSSPYYFNTDINNTGKNTEHNKNYKRYLFETNQKKDRLLLAIEEDMKLLSQQVLKIHFIYLFNINGDVNGNVNGDVNGDVKFYFGLMHRQYNYPPI